MPEYSCVEYLGILGREEIVQLLQKVSVGMCTLLDIGQYYKMQNFPTKVYEYMSMAIPVIVNDSPYNTKKVPELEIGYCVDPMDTEMAGKTIRQLLDDPVKCRTCGLNGREAIKNKFCWDREQHKLLALYKEILGE